MAHQTPSPRQIDYAASLVAQIESIESGASRTEVLDRAGQEFSDGTWSRQSLSQEIDFLKGELERIAKQHGVNLNGPSPAQIKFGTSLLTEHVGYLRKIAEVDGDTEDPDKWGDFLAELIEAFKAKTKREASVYIDTVRDANRGLNLRVRALVKDQGEDEDAKLIGWYRKGESNTELTLVKRTRERRVVVAYDVTLTEQGRQINYLGKKGLKGLTPEDKMTGDELGELTKLLEFSYCIECGRELSDPESIDRGIGPICAKKY